MNYRNINRTRTQLLLEVNHEINKKKRNFNEPLINSKSITDFIKEHDDVIISLRNQNYRASPKTIRRMSNNSEEKKALIEETQTKELFVNSNNMSYINEKFNIPKKRFTKLSSNLKKADYYSKNSDKALQETDLSSLYTKKTSNTINQVSDQGLNYLKNLVNKIKKKEDIFAKTHSLPYSSNSLADFSKNKSNFDCHNIKKIRETFNESHEICNSDDDLYSKGSNISNTSSNYTVTPMSVALVDLDDYSEKEITEYSEIQILENNEIFKCKNNNFSSYLNNFLLMNRIKSSFCKIKK